MRYDHPFNLKPDYYEYEKSGAYAAFKSATEEKPCAGEVFGALAATLKSVDLVYTDQKSVPVMDVGCGPADSIAKLYLPNTHQTHNGGYDVYAIDSNQDYAREVGGLARQNLTEVKRLGAELSGKRIRKVINHFQVANGDAFNGNILGSFNRNVLPAQQLQPNSIKLGVISHMFYHTEPDKMTEVLKDVANNVLAEDGVGVLFHLEAKKNSFQYFREKYGRQPGHEEGTTDTPAMGIGNPPEAVKEACASAEIPCKTMQFNNHYDFLPMEDKHWEMFKHPEQYKDITDENAKENLLKLYFIVQRAPNAFAADQSEHGLSAFIDEAKLVIAPNPSEFEQRGGVMALAETLQLIGSTRATHETKGKLDEVAEKLQPKLQGIADSNYEILHTPPEKARA